MNFGPHAVGAGAPLMFLPDIGTFFNQDTSLALHMVGQLAQSGVRVLKGEVLHSAAICLDDDTTVTYPARDGSQVTERYRALIERKTVSLDDYAAVFGHARSLGMEVVVSVYDREGLCFARDIGAAAIKIATSNIVHQPLIAWAAETKVPLIFDTGDSTLEEIARALGWARAAGCVQMLVEHSPYPPPHSVERHDLRFMVTLGTALGVPYGLSDHHSGEEMLYAAVALGACLVEKGVCPDGLDREQDAAHALAVSRVGEVLRRCELVRRALGKSHRNLAPDRVKKTSRMGMVARRDVASGQRVSTDTVDFAFPAKGIAVEHWPEVCGRTFVRDVSRGAPIRWGDVGG